MSSNYKNRIALFLVICLIIPAVLAFRLFFLQVLNYRFYLAKALEQRQRIITLAAPRGDILDRNKNLLATTVDSPSVFANPREITNEAFVAEELSKILGKENHSKFLKRLGQDRSFVWIERKVPDQQAQKISDLDLPGVYILMEKKRIYPNGHLASQILGFVGLDNQGLAGVELYFDEWLRGKEGKILAERDPLGRGIIAGQQVVLEEPSYGMNLTLTIDDYVQYVAEKRLKEAVQRHGGSRGSVVVMDVKQGEILAMASYPDFDPNNYLEYSSPYWKCGPVSFVYEPGSTFKVITVAAGIDSGVVNDETRLKFLQKITIGGKTISNAHPINKFSGTITVSEMLEESVNTGAVQVGLKLGKRRFYEYIKKFGFGQKLTIGLPDEARGIVHQLKYWYAPDVGMITFGQSIAVTPLQLANAFAAIANKGRLIKPILAKKIESLDGKFVKMFAKENLAQVISPQSAEKVIQMMENVTMLGTGKLAKMEYYRVASKTGTSQKAGQYGYLKDRYIASFIEFVPVSDPRFVILLLVDDPKGTIWGATVAAPAVKLIAEDVLRHFNVPPDIISKASL